jgi:cytidine deaminase
MADPLVPDKSTLKELADDEPQRHDLFIGLVAPIGSSRTEVRAALSECLVLYNYDVERVHLSGLLDSTAVRAGEPLPTREDRNYYKARMDAGDRLRESAGDWSALAAVAITRVAGLREERRSSVKDAKQLPRPVAYVFDSLKHPREAALLRSVYGSGFWLVSIVQDISERKQNLTEELARQEGQFDSVPESRAIDLISRDEADPDAAHGQHVRDVFAAADFFLPVQRGANWQEGVIRLCEGMFNAPFLTPSSDEEAMRHAQAAALRSAAIGRQVGAVIVPPLGAPYIHGTNEVPKPGGGQFREGDIPDHRDFQSGTDPNPAYTERLIVELLDRLATAGYFTPERNAAGGMAILREATQKNADGHSILEGTRARSLIEFTRCLHAEQAAIVNAARTGVAISGSKLYTTTFPCHECTKFIIGAGIIEVQYIEPYPKSLASSLYRDLIDPLPPLQSVGEAAQVLERVPFRPFLGFGPQRHDEVFAAAERKHGDILKAHVRSKACPIGHGWNEVAVRSKEDEVSVAVGEVVKRLEEIETSRSPTAPASVEHSGKTPGGSGDARTVGA